MASSVSGECGPWRLTVGRRTSRSLGGGVFDLAGLATSRPRPLPPRPRPELPSYGRASSRLLFSFLWRCQGGPASCCARCERPAIPSHHGGVRRRWAMSSKEGGGGGGKGTPAGDTMRAGHISWALEIPRLCLCLDSVRWLAPRLRPSHPSFIFRGASSVVHMSALQGFRTHDWLRTPPLHRSPIADVKYKYNIDIAMARRLKQ